VTDAAGKADLWRTALRQMVRRWVDDGVSVVIVNTVPRFPTFDLRRCPAFTAYSDPAACAEVRPSDQLSAFSRASRRAEQLSVEGVAHTSVLDLTRVVCPEQSCSTYRRGGFTYRDGFHLSVGYAVSLRPQLDAAVERALEADRPPRAAGRET
jgi:hypothetical protein